MSITVSYKEVRRGGDVNVVTAAVADDGVSTAGRDSLTVDGMMIVVSLTLDGEVAGVQVQGKDRKTVLETVRHELWSHGAAPELVARFDAFYGDFA